ncbi:MAG: high-affinity branched-chain amino acid ABC transporter permease LivM [Candidatus Adiutrix sp.]|nr:high-affinity branched-chain amino acid ABC transporter permease LivM [Candidatus Adiutrix sp.]
MPLQPGRFAWKREIRSSVLAAVWMALLTGPLVVIKLNTSDYSLTYRWSLLWKVAGWTFVLSAVWRWLLARRDSARRAAFLDEEGEPSRGRRGPDRTWVDVVMGARHRRQIIGLTIMGLMSIPFWASPYVVHIFITALIYIALGLGLNIVVGVSGLLNLGYVAFYAIGAYTYALLNFHFGLGFWICLPLGALTATVLGLLLGFPVLRLRGDYLAIVTLGFGEIVRLVLVNTELTQGPRGIGNISPPAIFGLDLNSLVKPVLLRLLPMMRPDLDLNKVLIFFIILALVILTIIAVFRLENSRLGRAWLALREDEVACQAMGINRTRAKLTAFALGATWAGLAGVVFASQVTFINPASFGFMQSVMILSIVVLGGMGSIPGVIIGALVLILLPEYLRNYQDYRMLLFGALMVMMMVLRPGGLIQSVRQVYIHRPAGPEAAGQDHPDSRGP